MTRSHRPSTSAATVWARALMRPLRHCRSIPSPKQPPPPLLLRRRAALRPCNHSCCWLRLVVTVVVVVVARLPQRLPQRRPRLRLRAPLSLWPRPSRSKGATCTSRPESAQHPEGLCDPGRSLAPRPLPPLLLLLRPQPPRPTTTTRMQAPHHQQQWPPPEAGRPSMRSTCPLAGWWGRPSWPTLGLELEPRQRAVAHATIAARPARARVVLVLALQLRLRLRLRTHQQPQREHLQRLELRR